MTLLLSGTAFALEGGLLGLTTGAPLINTAPIGDCGYVAGTPGTLTIETQPFNIVFDGLGGTNSNGVANPAGDAPGYAIYTLQIDSAGALTAGTVEVRGITQDIISTVFYGDPLLLGDITDFGIRDDGTNDVMDIRAIPTGGTLSTLYPANSDIATTLLLNTSTYDEITGFSSNWNCAGAKANIGSFSTEVAQGCNLTVTKTANRDTVGPKAYSSNYGSDSDSGSDRDGSGDSDDSDDYTPPEGGCKYKLTNLTMRWNAATAGNVSITKGDYDTLIYSNGAIQPGEEFTLVVGGSRSIKFWNNGDVVKRLYTSCDNPVGPGQRIGDFLVVDGTSHWPETVPLCPFPGNTCGPELEVTYTYEVTNTGPGDANNMVVYDDKLGVVSSYKTNANLVSLAAGAVETVQVTTCLFDTTTNTVSVFGGSDITGQACTNDDGEADNTVTVTLLPKDCSTSDSDSDSGIDTNANGDSDDSDDDSGSQDCDGDSGGTHSEYWNHDTNSYYDD